MRAEPVRFAAGPDEARCVLGESPRWDAATGRLLWVDIPAGRVHHFDPVVGATGVHELGELVSAIVRCADGWLVGVRRGVQFRDKNFALVAEVSDLPIGADTRLNDAAADRAGRLLIGSLATDGRPGAGRLLRVDPDGSHTTLLDGLDISNGLAFSVDESVLFHVDSGARTVRAHAYDSARGALGDSEIFYRHPADGGVPDGIAFDAEGGLWVAMWGGSRVIRLDGSGRVDVQVAVPARQPSSVCFGGAGLDHLYVTTAADGLADPADGDGRLYVCRPGVVGRVQNPVSTTPITWSDSSTRNRAR